MTRTLEIADATEPLASYVKQTERGPVVLTENGRPIAVIMAIENADLETISLSQNPESLATIERSRSRYQQEGGIGPHEVRRKLGLK